MLGVRRKQVNLRVLRAKSAKLADRARSTLVNPDRNTPDQASVSDLRETAPMIAANFGPCLRFAVMAKKTIRQ